MIKVLNWQIKQAFSRSQNFFQMNPVFPDMGEKDFDLYNAERKKINVVDAYQKIQNRQKQLRDIVRKKLYLPKYEKYKKFEKARTIRLDEQTKLPIGLDYDFDEFIKKFKSDKLVTKNAKSEFKSALFELVKKFDCKSEIQLIRLFRISIANSKKKTLLNKMRGKIMQQALMKASASRRMSMGKDNENLIGQIQEEQFEKLLKDLDDKIQKAEGQLRFNQYGIPKKMSNYDPQYGWKVLRQEKINQQYDLTSGIGYNNVVTSSLYDPNKKLQDQSIHARINRLYFLRRLQFLQKQEDENIQFFQDLPINLRHRQNIMNQLAHKYKEAQLLQQPDIADIYRQVDIVIDKIYIKIRPGTESRSETHKGEETFDNSPQTSDYLWENILAEEILCSEQYSYDSIKNTQLRQKNIKKLSPNPDLQISLSSLPINLYRHSQFEVFGIYNQHRGAPGRRLLAADEIDYEPEFKDFSIQQASKEYEKLEEKVKQGQQTSEGTAKRKTSQCQVFITKGTGLVTVNGKPIQDYFADVYHRVQALKPLVFTDTSGIYDLKFNVAGGGCHGQSECMAYALARALMKINRQHKSILSQFGLVGYDSRIKEPKKTNLYSARVRPPYVRR